MNEPTIETLVRRLSVLSIAKNSIRNEENSSPVQRKVVSPPVFPLTSDASFLYQDL